MKMSDVWESPKHHALKAESPSFAASGVEPQPQLRPGNTAGDIQPLFSTFPCPLATSDSKFLISSPAFQAWG